MISEVIFMGATAISLILKQQRNLNSMTPEEVIAELSKRGFSISVKALYAYESGTNFPKVPVFLALCDIYNIRDIMGSFGYSAPLCIGENEWTPDQYEDFFKVTLYEKIFLLAKWGIPSFDGYQKLLAEPGQFCLTDAEHEMIAKFRRLDGRGQAAVFNVLEHEYENLTGEEDNLLAKNA